MKMSDLYSQWHGLTKPPNLERIEHSLLGSKTEAQIIISEGCAKCLLRNTRQDIDRLLRCQSAVWGVRVWVDKKVKR